MHNRLITFLSLLVFLCFLSSSANVSAQAGGDDLVVVDIPYTSQEELAYLNNNYDLWHVGPESRLAKVMLTRSEFQALSDLGYRMTLDEANTTLANTGLEILPGQRSGIPSYPSYPCYRTVDETYASAEAIASTYPTLASWIDIGDSWERIHYGAGQGRDIKVLVLTNKAKGGDKAKILVNSGLHARELAPVELNMRFAEYLVANYGTDADITWLLDYNEVHLLLVSNPDGREQVETTGLQWRKNTNENYCGPTSTSRGADLNRNFDFYWNGGYSSTTPCSFDYRGSGALSEPESQAISAYELSIFPDQRGPNDSDPAPVDTTGIFIDLHSYGDLILWPYGFDWDSVAPNNLQLQTLGRKLAYFNDFSPYQANGLYPASGASEDYAYGTLGIAAYTIEMGSAFFQDCTTFETSIYPDNLEVLIYAVKSAHRPYQTPSGPDAFEISAPGEQLPFNQPFQVSATLDDTLYQTSYGYEITQNIQAARASIDAPPWEAKQFFNLQAVDGAFDEKNEEVSGIISPIGLVGGRHTLFIQGQDAAGNWGTVSAVFFETEYGYYFPLSYR
jgi:carboxypeptidase T